jgi:threonyl-tRNA synthetase
VGSDNQDHRPVMIHRAPFGSMERFCGVLIEHFAGNFPTWLAPEQVRILPMNDDLTEKAEECVRLLKDKGIRVGIDTLSGKLGAKIRKAETDKIPHMLILGKREAEEGKVSVRSRANPDLDGSCTLTEFTEKIIAEIETKSLPKPRETLAKDS